MINPGGTPQPPQILGFASNNAGNDTVVGKRLAAAFPLQLMHAHRYFDKRVVLIGYVCHRTSYTTHAY